MTTLILESIDQETLDKYLAYKLTSTQVAEMLGCHPVSVRRAIPRDRQTRSYFRVEAVKKAKADKQKLKKARLAWRIEQAGLPRQELAKKINASVSTADRLKQKARSQAK